MTHAIGNIQIHLQAKKPAEAFLESAYGAFRGLQWLDRAFNCLKLTGYATDFFAQSASACNKGWTMLALPRVPGAFESMKGEWSKISKMEILPGAQIRNYVNIAIETASFVSVTCYAAVPFVAAASKTTQVARLLRLGALTSFVSDACDFQRSSQDLLKVKEVAAQAVKEGASSELSVALEQTKNLSLLKTAKATSALAGVALGLATSIGSFPGAVTMAATLSLATTTLAIGASLYENGMQNERIKFFSDKHVELLSPATA